MLQAYNLKLFKCPSWEFKDSLSNSGDPDSNKCKEKCDMAQWYNILVPSKKINYSIVIAMVDTCIEYYVLSHT